MHNRKVLSVDYWKAARAKGQRSEQRRAAIAFVTEDLVGFSKGDTLVVNASLRAIRGGATKAKLLLKLHDKGVSIYNCPNLHAKVLLLGDTAIVGSGNMSDMSNRPVGGWQEAGLMTNDPIAAAGVASFVDQLTRPKDALLKRQRLLALTRIKVKRSGGGWGGKTGKRRRKVGQLGNRTWLTGLRETTLTPDEEQLVERTTKELGVASECMHYSRTARFAQECRPGDSVVVIWKPNAKSRVTVYRAVPILRKRQTKKRAFIFYPEVSGKYAEISWTNFNALLKRITYHRKVRPGSTQLMPIDMADAFAKHWNAVAKQ